MAVARTAFVLIGTSESSGASIANNASSSSSETDLLGDDLSEGFVLLYQQFTSTVTTGSIDTKLTTSRVATKPYASSASVDSSNAPINGTVNPKAVLLTADRLVTLTMTNNATTVTATGVLGAVNSYKES